MSGWMSIIIYLGSFTLSALCAYQWKRTQRRHWLWLCVLIPSLVAGLRANTVGTDVRIYGDYTFSILRQKGISYALSNPSHIEPLYCLLNYGIGLFTNNPHWMYFFIELFIMSFFVAGCIRLADSIPIGYALFTFLILFYADHLNAMRQSMAVAVLFYLFCRLVNRERVHVWFWILFAMGFHITAIIGIFLYVVYWLANHEQNPILYIVWIGVGIFILVFYKVILIELIRWGILPDKFYRYIVQTGFTFSWNTLLVRLPFLFVILLYAPFLQTYYPQGRFFIVCVVLDLIFSQMRGLHTSLYRITMYFGVFRTMAYGSVIGVMDKNKQLFGRLLIVYLIFVWIYQVVLQNNGEIFPYALWFM